MGTISEVLALESTQDADVFAGPAIPSQIERTFGGQVAAQALTAAQRTVEDKQVHSLHGYFVGPGDTKNPLEL